MAQQAQSEEQYQPKDALGAALKATAVTTAAGAFVSTIQNTLTKQNVGAFGIFTKTGSTIAVFAAMGGAYEFTKSASANLREKDDVWNPTLGGFVAGTMMGLRFRSGPAIIGYGSALAIVLGAFTYTGGKLRGYTSDPDVDEVSRKEYLRKNRRRPIEQVVNELGEGRGKFKILEETHEEFSTWNANDMTGVYAPGYEQRRAERIKEKYGIDVPVQSPLASS